MNPAHRAVLFRRDWWLDAVAPGAWGEVTVQEGGRVRAHLPYMVRRLPVGITALLSPPLTPWLGPWVDDGGDAPALVAQLIERLPRFRYFAQTFDPAVVDWTPFQRQGFTAATRYTYRIDDISDLDRVWSAMGAKTRNVVRRAQREVAIRDDLGFADLSRMLGATFSRQGLAVPFTDDLLRRTYEAALGHDCGKALYAVGADGALHAAALIVWDERWAYYLLGGADPALRRSGATSLVLWEAIRHVATRTRGFDFEGSMLPGVARFFQSFGAEQVPYLSVRRASPAMRAALAVRHRLRSSSRHP